MINSSVQQNLLSKQSDEGLRTPGGSAREGGSSSGEARGSTEKQEGRPSGARPTVMRVSRVRRLTRPAGEQTPMGLKWGGGPRCYQRVNKQQLNGAINRGWPAVLLD